MESEGRKDPIDQSPGALISNEIVRLEKSLMGRGPTRTKTYLHDDCVVVLMREAHTTAEEHMATGGRQRAVAQTRVDLSEDERDAFIAVIEQHTGRKVVGFMSSSTQDPSLLAQVFVLDTSPLLVDPPEAG